MKWLNAAALAAAVLVSCAYPLTAQDIQPPPTADATDEGDPHLTQWEWQQEVRLPPPKDKAAYYAIQLPPSVLGKAQHDRDLFGKGRPMIDGLTTHLPDLRLTDADGTRIPYALRVLQTRQVQRPVQIVRDFDAGPVKSKNYYETTLELGDVGPLGHNEIEIATGGIDYRRKVEILGDVTAKFEEPRALLDQDRFIARFQMDGTIIDLRKLRYPPNQVRFLKVRVYADPSNGEAIPKIDGLIVRYTAATLGEDVTFPVVQLGPREPVRGDGGPGSAWYIDLAPDAVPCRKLTFRVEGSPVERPFHVDVADADALQKFVPAHKWTWRKTDQGLLLDIELFEEVWAKRLRLVITDFANPPLDLHGAQYTAAVRQLVFALPDPAKFKLPLRLYYGNPQATPANYDFARKLAQTTLPALVNADLAGPMKNPAYIPPTPPLAERMPWLIYTMLGLTSAVLLGILAVLARTALRRHARLNADPNVKARTITACADD